MKTATKKNKMVYFGSSKLVFICHCQGKFIKIKVSVLSFLNTIYLLSFVETPRKFIIAELSIRKLGSSSVLIILLKIIISANNSIISTDEDPSLRIESSAIINLRGVSTKLNKYKRSVFIKMFIKMFISKEYVEKYGKKNNKNINLSINSCQFIAVVFCCKIQIKARHALEYFLTREKSHG